MKLSIVLAISHYRKQTLDLAATFTVDEPLCHCHNIDGLFQKLSEAHIGDERRLFQQLLKKKLVSCIAAKRKYKTIYP